MRSLVIKKYVKGQLIEAYKKGVKYLWDYAIVKFNLSQNSKESIIWTYRLHYPNISLEDGIKDLINELIQSKCKIFFISDGRVFSQRLKLQATGLNHIRSLISEEYGDLKPNVRRFKKINLEWPDYKFAYIADNTAKDFHAPKKLGWLCIGAEWVKDRIHQNRKMVLNLMYGQKT